jgi:lipopolysaccharide export LptBFGC system permease protein LptF
MDKYLFEAIMLICFGISWPVSIAKALRTKFVRGKSRLFMTFVIVGYLSGVLHKFLNPDSATHRVHPVVWLYIFNLAMVVVDLLLYMRYRHNPEQPAVAEPEGP